MQSFGISSVLKIRALVLKYEKDQMLFELRHWFEETNSYDDVNLINKQNWAHGIYQALSDAMEL